jgi:hypothetical protein
MPQPLVGRDQAFHVAPPCAIGRKRPPGQHHLQDMKKLLRDFEIRLVAGVMESDQDFRGRYRLQYGSPPPLT